MSRKILSSQALDSSIYLELEMETTLWHELDDQTSETISGGEQVEGCLAWSIRFGDVTRPPRNSSSGLSLIIWF
ncbi:MAG: hypothetical protein F6K28_49460 [Microcoleus sp. SIO2G3]|nr:hypothetical protein [Microcoleus sp. SIO2G3]